MSDFLFNFALAIGGASMFALVLGIGAWLTEKADKSFVVERAIEDHETEQRVLRNDWLQAKDLAISAAMRRTA